MSNIEEKKHWCLALMPVTSGLHYRDESISSVLPSSQLGSPKAYEKDIASLLYPALLNLGGLQRAEKQKTIYRRKVKPLK